MELAVFSPVFGKMSLEESLKFLNERGVKSLELGVGGYPGTNQANAKELIKDDKKVDALKELLKKYQVKICALSVHGNAVHPNKAVASGFQEDFEAAVILAEKMEIHKIITFSGCPGDSNGSKYPNWVTCPWPDDFRAVLDYQWNEVLIPYWKKAVKFANEHKVTEIALELHPGFCCYNPETLLRLRKAVGETIGANFDPSHLIWQGIDPTQAIKELKGAIYHFHAKDTAINKYNVAVNGVLDSKPFNMEAERSWIFRTVGFGTDELKWKEMFSALNLYGYSGAVSIEHEDSLIDNLEGLDKAIKFLKNIIIEKPKLQELWWN